MFGRRLPNFCGTGAGSRAPARAPFMAPPPRGARATGLRGLRPLGLSAGRARPAASKPRGPPLRSPRPIRSGGRGAGFGPLRAPLAGPAPLPSPAPPGAFLAPPRAPLVSRPPAGRRGPPGAARGAGDAPAWGLARASGPPPPGPGPAPRAALTALLGYHGRSFKEARKSTLFARQRSTSSAFIRHSHP